MDDMIANIEDKLRYSFDEANRYSDMLPVIEDALEFVEIAEKFDFRSKRLTNLRHKLTVIKLLIKENTSNDLDIEDMMDHMMMILV